MAIKFTFTLNDADAENLFDYLHVEEMRLREQIVKEQIGDNRTSSVERYHGHIAYIHRMKKKMLACQERLPEAPEHDCTLPSKPIKVEPK